MCGTAHQPLPGFELKQAFSPLDKYMLIECSVVPGRCSGERKKGSVAKQEVRVPASQGSSFAGEELVEEDVLPRATGPQETRSLRTSQQRFRPLPSKSSKGRRSNMARLQPQAVLGRGLLVPLTHTPMGSGQTA